MEQIIEPLSQFGVAGLMGLLWVWERTLSRRRETQLDEAHRKLLRRAGEMRQLMRTINRNTRVIERFEQTHQAVLRLLERSHDEPLAREDQTDRADDGDQRRDDRLHVAPGRDAAASRDRVGA